MSARQTVRVIDIRLECPGVKKFTLVGNYPLVGFSGGAHVTTYLPHMQRQYSLISSPLDNRSYEIAVRRSETSAGGSQYWHEEVKIGDVLEISWPKNHFPLSFRAKHHVFYAAGIGITPFLSMMAELNCKGISFELHYTARTREDCAFYEFISREYKDQASFYFSREQGGARMKIESLLDHRIGTHVYFCGPEGMIRAFRLAASDYGYPPSSVHWERFAPPAGGTNHPFWVELLRSGKSLEVPANKTILDVMLQAGIKTPYSCKVGGCGSCELPFVAGEVDHRDDYLTEEQQQRVMLPCVSRAKGSKIVLDV